MGLGFAPNVGMLYENASINKLNKPIVEQTGGGILLASTGMEINFQELH